ncbi:serine/threonine-protein kinase ZRK1-like [Corylus avellana]|uniref:serine/threonine-protein kinase ZRK1-like n=1 Tax=Corylus avellana TaxID=13451 RepID=UPI00286AD9B7|nr:serine/threonine-protein kinase ZRK1-like [Corylus avellana]
MPLTKKEERAKKREEERERKRAFIKNGGLVLEKLVASCNGRPIPIRTFSYKELLLATNNFDPRHISHIGALYKLYHGTFEGRFISIKLYGERSTKDMALSDLAISAKTSAHKNIQKLVGCCLETSIPALVFQYAQNGALADRIYISRRSGTPMVWQSRLKIGRAIAHAIACLHTAFSRPIIHRDIKLQNIYLDQLNVPKLKDFSLSISIPEGETHVVVDKVCGTRGFSCSSYMLTNTVTEKTDVYSFGVVLLELLTGQDSAGLLRLAYGNNILVDYFLENNKKLKDSLRNRALNEIVDPAILGEGGVGVEQQLQSVVQLSVICIEDDPVIRPTMVEVTKELRRIERYIA